METTITLAAIKGSVDGPPFEALLFEALLLSLFARSPTAFKMGINVAAEAFQPVQKLGESGFVFVRLSVFLVFHKAPELEFCKGRAI